MLQGFYYSGYRLDKITHDVTFYFFIPLALFLLFCVILETDFDGYSFLLLENKSQREIDPE